MGLDLFVLGLAAFIAGVGALQGGSRQLGQLAGWVAGALLAWPTARFLGPVVSSELDWPEPVAALACGVVAFLGVMILVRLFVADSIRTLLRHDEDEAETQRRDRWLGLGVGAARAVVATYLVLSALVFVEKNVSSLLNRKVGVLPGDSVAVSFAREHGLFQSMGGKKAPGLPQPVLQWISLAQAMADPDRLAELQGDPAFRAIQDDPRVRQALESPEVREAAERGDAEALLSDPAIKALLKDRDLARKVAARDWTAE